MIMTQKIYYTEMDSSIGPLTIVGTIEMGLCNIEFGSIDSVQDNLANWLKKQSIKGELLYSNEVLQPVIEVLNQYFAGNHKKNFDIAIDLHGTPFQKKVWNELLNIEYGTTKSYKEIAEAISAPKAVRAIGTAIGQNPIPIIVPCHRVINSNGKLGGFTGGLEKKMKLLEIEKL
ncbi:MAG TPA: methylated-DNA--[protein]-cysteine S-methyltransferase [Bacillus bacterium]|nr:methylated-DNA--[protein]-cysteine S-methyltransferase [Bacillus sp. (in: firmicutes)]